MRSPGCRTGCSLSTCSTGRSSARSASRDYVFAMLVLGLDRFKVVNQSLGVLSADRLLVSVARRLQAESARDRRRLARRGGFTLARLGGDEFMVLLDDITDASDAVRVAERLRAALSTPFDVEGHQVFTSAAVGITVSTTGYERPEAAAAGCGDRAPPRQDRQRAPYELFDPAMRERAMTRLQLETDLRNAIDNKEISVLYQPIISLITGSIKGFEALARWNHRDARTHQPRRFHSDCRRYRPDSTARQARPRRVVPSDGGMAAAVRPPCAGLHVRQRLRRSARAADLAARSRRFSMRPGSSRRS